MKKMTLRESTSYKLLLRLMARFTQAGGILHGKKKQKKIVFILYIKINIFRLTFSRSTFVIYINTSRIEIRK